MKLEILGVCISHVMYICLEILISNYTQLFLVQLCVNVNTHINIYVYILSAFSPILD